jgi:hypothetical protein
MRGTTIRLWALFIPILAGCALARGQELTPDAAKAMLDQQGAGTNASDFTLTQDQAHALTALSPDLLAQLQIQANQPCLPNPGDKRVQRHQFAACQGIFPTGISDQNPGVYLKVGRIFHWHIVGVRLLRPSCGFAEGPEPGLAPRRTLAVPDGRRHLEVDGLPVGVPVDQSTDAVKRRPMPRDWSPAA